MAEKINFIKIAENLTPKEKAQMLAFDLDKILLNGKEVMSSEEVDNMMTFDRASDIAEYDFFMSLRMFGMLYIINNIEICVLKFSMGFQLINHSNQNAITYEDKSVLRESLQEHYNLAYSLNELASNLSQEFDFPVLGTFYENLVTEKLDYLEILKNVVNNAVLAEYSRQAKTKNKGKTIEPSLFIRDITLDKKMIDSLIATFVRLKERTLISNK
jgi:hypothetical protein